MNKKPVLSNLVSYLGEVYAQLRRVDDGEGNVSLTLAGKPRRLFVGGTRLPLVMQEIPVEQITGVPSPANLLADAKTEDNWLSRSRSAQKALAASFLFSEDRHHRLVAQPFAILRHQASLIEHVLSNPNLYRVLIGDEVGLGKTIESGQIVQKLLKANPNIRILYLSPAKLVKNVASEFRKLNLEPHCYVAPPGNNARINKDQLVIASIEKAVYHSNMQKVLKSGHWDVIIVDECHHLSDWKAGGGKATRKYRLVRDLAAQLSHDGRLILMSGTPHQGNPVRFENLLKFLRQEEETLEAVSGRVICRTKEQIFDWKGRKLFPDRDIREPTVIDLGPEYNCWYNDVANLYGSGNSSPDDRVLGFAQGGTLERVASSVSAGLATLCHMAIRHLKWGPHHPALAEALAALRPYRNGSPSESITSLYERIHTKIEQEQDRKSRKKAIEDNGDDETSGKAKSDKIPWTPDPDKLEAVLKQGVALANSTSSQTKWLVLKDILAEAGGEKVVMFATSIETVMLVAKLLEDWFGKKPAIIIGDMLADERNQQIKRFWQADGPQYLVSSKAGGEGINLHCAHRLVHLDVPWNPMELEQRTGRIHRFGSIDTIIVHTLFIAGTREQDMYVRAWAKMTQIASDLSPNKRRERMGRVMNLIPPAVLEGELSNMGSENYEPTSIGRLVQEGFDQLQSFEQASRQQQDLVPDVDPGMAEWSDLKQFLVNFCGAKEAPDVTKEIFFFQDGERVVENESLAAITFDKKLCVCGDISGMPISAPDGSPVHPLGMNQPEVMKRINDAFQDGLSSSAAYLRLDASTPLPDGLAQPFGILVSLRQTVQFDRGHASERGINLQLLIVPQQGNPLIGNGAEYVDLIRALTVATRQQSPDADSISLAKRLAQHEENFWRSVRYRSTEDKRHNVHHVSWPAFAAVVT